MPFLKIQTNTELPETAARALAARASALVADQLGKPERYVMVSVERSDELIDTIKKLILDSDYTALAQYLGDDADALGIKMLSDWNEVLYGEVRAVEVGLQNAFYAQIVSGLSEGETVLLATSDSSDDTANFMPGMDAILGESGKRPEGMQRPNQ